MKLDSLPERRALKRGERVDFTDLQCEFHGLHECEVCELHQEVEVLRELLAMTVHLASGPCCSRESAEAEARKLLSMNEYSVDSVQG